MVDVTAKAVTGRRATAWCRVRLGAGGGPAGGPADDSAGVATAPVGGALLESARVAGILGATRASALIPLCHPLPVDDVAIDLAATGSAVEIRASVTTWARTGVEMEALTACTVAALTLMSEWGGPGSAVLEELLLLEKAGGRSGDWRHPFADQG